MHAEFMKLLLWAGIVAFVIPHAEAKLMDNPGPSSAEKSERGVLSNQNPALIMSATPAVITLGLTDELEVKCQYQGPLTVMAIGIGKLKGGKRQGLAYITSTKPKDVKNNMESTLNAEFNGELNINGGGGYLSIKWKDPTRDEAGVYECLVNTMKGFGKMENEKGRVGVKANRLSLQSLAEYTKEITSKMKQENDRRDEKIANLEAALAEEKQAMSSVQAALFTQSSEYNGRTYYITEYLAMTYLKSKEVCNALGGYLAEIDDKEEYEFVKSFAKVLMSRRSIILLGGSDAQREGSWIFERTKKPITYFDWLPGQPNNDSGGQGCMSLEFYGNRVGMNDMKCHSGPSGWNWVYGFICEVPNKGA